MEFIAKILRALSRIRFKLLGLSTIVDIPTDDFNRLIESLIAADWKPSKEYKGHDAWIDYGRIVLRKGKFKLTLEWDNWTEGRIEGPRTQVQAIIRDYGFAVSDQ
jgi:hypothetical protein